ncbi:MAG: hypothetical protein GY761_08535 [Hyphomicrobiales bacterium]|nr:hypothetical protein [Hyphomicrobiales bacterium]
MKKYLCYLCIVIEVSVAAGLANATANEDVLRAAPVQSTTLLAASNCDARANALASSYANATILSVTNNGNSCTIVIRVKDASGGRSRIIKKTISG